jgi:hypothetical protein
MSFGKNQNMVKQPHRKLSAHDVAFGIGRVATDEELKEYLDRPVGKFKDSKKVVKEIKAQLNFRIKSHQSQQL